MTYRRARGLTRPHVTGVWTFASFLPLHSRERPLPS